MKKIVYGTTKAFIRTSHFVTSYIITGRGRVGYYGSGNIYVHGSDSSKLVETVT